MAAALVRAVRQELWGTLPFLTLFFVGFAWVGTVSLREWWLRRPAPPGHALPVGAEQTAPTSS